jgi:hypothetical protein
MVDRRHKSWFGAAALAGLATLGWITLATRADSQSSTAPQYNAAGELQTPSGFET